MKKIRICLAVLSLIMSIICFCTNHPLRGLGFAFVSLYLFLYKKKNKSNDHYRPRRRV